MVTQSISNILYLFLYFISLIIFLVSNPQLFLFHPTTTQPFRNLYQSSLIYTHRKGRSSMNIPDAFHHCQQNNLRAYPFSHRKTSRVVDWKSRSLARSLPPTVRCSTTTPRTPNVVACSSGKWCVRKDVRVFCFCGFLSGRCWLRQRLGLFRKSGRRSLLVQCRRLGPGLAVGTMLPLHRKKTRSAFNVLKAPRVCYYYNTRIYGFFHSQSIVTGSTGR